jgi:hypothetical protein
LIMEKNRVKLNKSKSENVKSWFSFAYNLRREW